jgi:hypothetical protein
MNRSALAVMVLGAVLTVHRQPLCPPTARDAVGGFDLEGRGIDPFHGS